MKKIPLSQGKFALIDDEDFDFVSQLNWYCSSHGYARESKTKIYLHRFIMNPDDDFVVDHINGDKLDNRKENLRICTQRDNTLNKRNRTNQTIGIRETKFGWNADIAYKGHKYHIGNFKSKEDAMIAYNRKAKELHGEFATLNHITDDGRKLITVLQGKKTSNYLGVYRHSSGSKWVSQYFHKGKAHYIGIFDDELIAAKAYNDAVVGIPDKKLKLNII